MNGFGYVIFDGFVYFDIDLFEKVGYSYFWLELWNKNDFVFLVDGEGLLFKGVFMKRSLNYFVLWKVSKLGELVWDSLWGCGWFGWYIECFVMVLEVIGKMMDIYFGGVDFCFFYYDNELV